MTTPQSPLRELERVVALVEKATPGPREALTPCEPHDYVTDIRSDDDGQLVAATYTEHDGRMIAAAVNFIRDHGSALIAELGQEVGAVDEDAQDVPVWTLLGLAEQCGAVRDSDDNSTWWTLGLDAAYKLEEMLRAHGVSAGWASSPAHTSEARDATLAEKLAGSIRFILAFYEPGQTYLDTNAWTQAEAGARHALAEYDAAMCQEGGTP